MRTSRWPKFAIPPFGLSLALGCGQSEGDLLTPACGSSASGAEMPCPDTWPNNTSRANSDTWLAAHHDELTTIHPRVLLLHFDNQITMSQVRSNTDVLIQNLAEGSRYHGYSSAFLQYELAYAIDLTDRTPPSGWENAYSSQLPTTSGGELDPGPLFGQHFADLYQIPDPTAPSRRLALCELFERGVINEVWLHIGEPPPLSTPSILERRQLYDAAGRASAGAFLTTAGSPAQAQALDTADCAVTMRMVVIVPLTTPQDNAPPVGRDVACSLMAHGFGIETMALSIPYLTIHARPFLNLDLRSRYHVTFDAWRDICRSDFAPCVSYFSDAAGQWSASPATGATVSGWKMSPFRQGCGTVDFPPNARFRWDFDNRETNQAVPSRCEHYGRRDGPDGYDTYLPYLADTTDGPQGPFNCGPAWQMFWRQSIPGYGNVALDVDGRPMKNWWPYLFY